MEPPIKIDPEIMGGTPCFNGTRVPVEILFDLLRRGRTVEQFLEDFPSVLRPQVDEILKLASADVLRHALRIGAA
ncbi:MAG: DUF433 domain-containing protein [Tepidisphaeraceae bacterium]